MAGRSGMATREGESLETRYVGGLLVVYVCVFLPSPMDAKRQFARNAKTIIKAAGVQRTTAGQTALL
jgi:hypothetical protein